MSEGQHGGLVTITADLTSAYLSNNHVSAGDVPALIGLIHRSLAGLGSAPKQAHDERREPATTVRKSLAKPDRILSMIDGQPYVSLKRHLRRHGFTPQSYREAFGLPADYPMTAPAFSARRREIAQAIGLGQRRRKAAEPDGAGVAEPTAEAPRRRRRAAEPEGSPAAPQAPKRGRPRKAEQASHPAG